MDGEKGIKDFPSAGAEMCLLLLGLRDTQHRLRSSIMLSILNEHKHFVPQHRKAITHACEDHGLLGLP